MQKVCSFAFNSSPRSTSTGVVLLSVDGLLDLLLSTGVAEREQFCKAEGLACFDLFLTGPFTSTFTDELLLIELLTESLPKVK